MKPSSFMLCCLAVIAFAASADEPVDFSGNWVATEKNTDATDGSSSKPAPSGNHGGGGHGHGGMGGGGHHGHAADSSSTSTNATWTGEDPRLHAHSLIIRQSDMVFDIDASGQRIAYRFDNRNNYGAAYGGTVTLKWTTPEMVIETHPDGGGALVEHYTMSDDNQHMTLVIRNEGVDGSAHEVRRTFQRNANDAAASAQTLP
jgi:hypothetical protein